MKVVIAGSRTFIDYAVLRERCDIILDGEDVEAILCGECRGADMMGKDYALERGIDVESYPADWKKYGRAAGAIRNKQMAQNADLLIAFWDGKSKGTKMMIQFMQLKGGRVEIVHV